MQYKRRNAAVPAKVTKSAVLTVRLTPEVKAALEAAAASERRSLANMLEVAVLEYCRLHGVVPGASKVRGKTK